MKKIFTLLTGIIISLSVFAHNPLQGTKWVMNDEGGKATFTIDFSSAASGNVIIDGKECMFMYGANHTNLFIKMNKCEGMDKNIIPCCEQSSIPFRSDENGNLVLIIDENEYVLQAIR